MNIWSEFEVSPQHLPISTKNCKKHVRLGNFWLFCETTLLVSYAVLCLIIGTNI